MRDSIIFFKSVAELTAPLNKTGTVGTPILFAHDSTSCQESHVDESLLRSRALKRRNMQAAHHTQLNVLHNTTRRIIVMRRGCDLSSAACNALSASNDA